ncbi:uncharacterized protein LOC119276809 [Triticum dicoccoides]|uniref:uncharacterized protein LOC119276809 n=1 Tax=Triticum dicoccoides TaxID=85692 RepID=UPI00188E9010|nr:uncharacterized protein LOC119276809 [Triticum dicoccoides]
MASQQPPPSPPLSVPTTISALTDDLLREVFLRLPDLPSLVCAAFTCRAFLRAARSSPPFRRRFRDLHAPPLLALFREPDMSAVVPAASRSSDPAIAGAFADLLRDDDASEWWTYSQIPYSDEFVQFVNRSTERVVSYNPHMPSLAIFPKKPHDEPYLEFHTLPPDQEHQSPSRVVCVRHDFQWACARVAVFSSHAMKWQIFPESRKPLLQGDMHTISTVVDRFVCWLDLEEDCILALNTATFQFCRMDLPPSLRGSYSRFKIGQTRDGRLCMVNVQECTLSVWLWTPDDVGIGRFVLHKMFPLHAIVKEITKRPVKDNVDVGDLMEVINGFVYLSVVYSRDPQSSEWFLSFCLETAEVNLLFKETRRSYCPVDPYIMVWPPSLIHNKEGSETEVTGDSAGADGPVHTKDASPVLFTALQSFKEALIDGDGTKIAEMEAFLLDAELGSLLNRITTLDVALAAGRDRVLRIGARSDICREEMGGEGWWQMFKGVLWRASSRLFAS